MYIIVLFFPPMNKQTNASTSSLWLLIIDSAAAAASNPLSFKTIQFYPNKSFAVQNHFEVRLHIVLHPIDQFILTVLVLWLIKWINNLQNCLF